MTPSDTAAPKGTTGGKRVLLLTKTDFAEPKDGGTLRVAAIADSLHDAGFNIDAVAIRAAGRREHRNRGGYAAAARVALATVRVGSVSVARWYSPAVAREIAALLRNNTYDAVLLEYSQLLVYRCLFGARPVVLDMHNVEHELLANYATSSKSLWRRAIARYEAHRVRRLENRCRLLADAVVTVSEHDAGIVRRSRGNAVVQVAPNGVSAAAFDVTRSASPVPTVVFIGHLGWQPNIEAAHWLVQEVWPIVKTECPDAKLHLIGRLPARSLAGYDGRKGVSIHADVPSTLKYLSKATVATAPLLAAGGTRLKILEAMATGTPVVSTSRGALGLEQLQHPDALVVADSAAEFAHAITLLMSSTPHPDVVRRQVEGYRWRRVLSSLVDVVDGQCREPTGSHDRIPMTVASDGRETLQCRTQSPARS